MLLVVDIGNTNMEVGFYDGETFTTSERLSTNIKKTMIEFAMDLSFICEANGVDPDLIEGAIMASVVPPVNHPFSEGDREKTADHRSWN